MKVIRKLLLDFVPVLFGVLLAIMINDFMEDRKASRLRSDNLATLKKKCTLNQEEMTGVLENHEALVKALQESRPDQNLLEVLAIVDGFKTGGLNALSPPNAFDSPKDYALNLQLEDIQQQHALIREMTSTITDLILDKINSSENSEKEKLLYSMIAFIHLENVALEKYQEIQEYLEG